MRYQDDELIDDGVTSRVMRALSALVRAGEGLEAACDSSDVLRVALTTLVPEFGDGCVIQLADAANPSAPRRVALAHADPDVEQALREHFDLHALQATSLGAQCREAMRTRRPVVSLRSATHTADSTTGENVEWAVTSSLANASVVAPLVARGRVLGILALLGDSSGREYDLAEALLVADLSRQVAAALDAGSRAHDSERRQSERALASLVEHSADFIVRFDETLRYEFVSPSITRATGIAAERYLGHAMTELGMSAELVTLWETNLRRALESGGPVQFLQSYALPGGEGREYETLLVVEHGDSTGPRSVLGYSRDVSALHHARKRLQETLDRVTDVVVLFDRDLRIMDLNQGALEALRAPRSQVVGKTVAEFFGTPVGVSDELLSATLESNAPQVTELQHPGDGRWYSVQAYPSEHGIAVFARDVTDRRRAEAQERDARAELEKSVAERTRELAEANAQLNAASRQKSEFLTSVSHELRTPLNAVIGFTEMVRDGRAGPVSPEQRELLEDALGGASQLRMLVDDLLDTARVEAGAMRIEPSPVSIADLLEEVRDTLRGLAAERALQLEIDRESESFDVVVDRQRLRQVLLNFASNAIKFTGRGGSVTLRARHDATGWFRVEVEDTGIGIAEEDQVHLFQAFVQVASAGFSRNDAGGSTGLGLALSRKIAALLGGTVGMESTRGEGSRFYVLLPISPPAANVIMSGAHSLDRVTAVTSKRSSAVEH